ncbi:hypothetical protein GCG21_08475 [Pseudactinotalea sp. HY160]|uniref:DUF6318 family protein n=1 Tax=Pseudactinotalea sp. HY160 TaxID=2654490 RepID=UPI00128CBD0F|nr:DUF6318 family protein [Pseudactinotalea sp. HY160]MPV50039.1 hypothetical protein [Pseudactinotalea sp. HY160]
MLTRVGSRRTGIAATILAGTMLVTGCSGGDEPSAGPPTTDTAGPTTTEPPTTEQTTPNEEPVPEPNPLPKPERPAAMDDTGAKGAIAAAEYFLELHNYAASTGDISDFQAMGRDACDFCNAMTATFKDVYSNDGWIVGISAHISNPVATRTIDDLAYEVAFDLNLDSGASYTNEGLVKRYGESQEVGTRIVVQHFADWQVVALFSGTEIE